MKVQVRTGNMMSVFKLILLSAIFLPLASTRRVPFFRRDYTYIEEFDAFYKLHWDLQGSSWNSAFRACDDEGAVFFYPKVKDEWTLVKNLTNKMMEAPNVSEIFVGLHDEYGVGQYITVDGHTTPSPLLIEGSDSTLEWNSGNCIIMNINTGSYRVAPCTNEEPGEPLPFVCKKIDNKSCPTVDREYKYVESLNKCYKVNRKQKTWDEAMRTCFMEGGILTVIQNQAEATKIREHLTNYLYYHVGFRRIFSQSDYYTVKGHTFDSVYQNNDDFGNENCGAVNARDSYLYTLTKACSERLPFICEMELNSN